MEILLSIAVYTGFIILFETLLGNRAKNNTDYSASEINTATPSFFTICALYAVAGAMIGSLSLLIFPQSLIAGDTGRFLNLIFSPLIIGTVVALICRYLKKHNKDVELKTNFYHSFAFAFGFALIRFLFTTTS